MKTLLLLICLTASVFAQMSEADFTTFRDSDYPYALRYPRSWLQVEPSNAITRFKLVSDGGQGSADMSVNVVPMPSAKGKSYDTYFKLTKANPKGVLQMLRKQLPTAELVSHGDSKIANLPAYYLIIDFTQQGGPIEIPYRMIQYSFGRDGFKYTLTFRSYREDWDINKQIFDFITFTFAFAPLK